MIGISDMMLTGGAGVLIPSLHGETVTVLNGPDAGKTFTAVVEIEHDQTLSADGMGMDRRAKRMIRFTVGSVPRLKGKTQIQTSDGKQWWTVDDPQNGYLTTDFELQQIVPGIDQK